MDRVSIIFVGSGSIPIGDQAYLSIRRINGNCITMLVSYEDSIKDELINLLKVFKINNFILIAKQKDRKVELNTKINDIINVKESFFNNLNFN